MKESFFLHFYKYARVRVHSAGVAMSMLAFAVRRGVHVFRDAARVTGVRPLASFHTSAQVRDPPGLRDRDNVP